MHVHVAPIFHGQRFCENVENHAYVNFCDKSFVIVHGEPTPVAHCSNFRDWMSNPKMHENIML